MAARGRRSQLYSRRGSEHVSASFAFLRICRATGAVSPFLEFLSREACVHVWVADCRWLFAAESMISSCSTRKGRTGA